MVSALASLAASEDTLEEVVSACTTAAESAVPMPGAAYAIAVGDADRVLRVVLHALWAIPKQVHMLMSTDRTGMSCAIYIITEVCPMWDDVDGNMDVRTCHLGIGEMSGRGSVTRGAWVR